MEKRRIPLIEKNKEEINLEQYKELGYKLDGNCKECPKQEFCQICYECIIYNYS